ncbi:OLC1v1029361C1 [Oldenlandia corymbosa var. corymbosa]|uniref:RNA helicase n=1 Tax=Oldenlandia corymbosa var. corymbosa TaxID=529605 RepID=A0AAV1CE76_OLDCO|nr:OLC1v1029361C1 [Oldenlandia corymbosa var. corymbosa]
MVGECGHEGESIKADVVKKVVRTLMESLRTPKLSQHIIKIPQRFYKILTLTNTLEQRESVPPPPPKAKTAAVAIQLHLSSEPSGQKQPMESVGSPPAKADMYDSNAMILPGKKEKKNKKNQVPGKLKGVSEPKLSKSQQRKLKKLEEEKEKADLLSRSLDTLKKCKLSDDVYSLMWSSRNLGQVETVREKRQREVHYSKAGLQLPHSHQPIKKRAIDRFADEVEHYDDKIELKSYNLTQEQRGVLNNSSISSLSSENLNVQDDVHSPRHADIPRKLGAGDDKMMLSRPEYLQKSLSSCGGDDKDKCDEDKRYDLTTSFPANSETRRSLASSGLKQKDVPETPLDNSRFHFCPFQERSLVAPTVVHVSRPKEVESQRKNLPIVMMEQEIMEAINENASVIICGETGCGKTTQVPQFLYEAGYGSKDSSIRGGIIGVTQPRRVAVLATAKRVAFELDVRLGKEVGFQVRHDKRVGDKCHIKFMTDGILLREIQADFLLRRYSVIILDEAHERSLNTDILIGMLSRVIPERQRQYEEQQKKILSGEYINPENRIYPLKLVLMSATLRVEDFISGKRIFQSPPPVIEVPTRQYPVTVHFSKRTDVVDYVGQAYKKVLSIHKKLPPGGILVFLTGQREVEYLCRKLRKALKEIIDKVANGHDQPASEFGDSPTELNDMKDINEAFESQGSSNCEITDRFSSYDGDYDDLSEDDSESYYDSEDDSDLEFTNPGENLLNLKSPESDDTLTNVLQEDGNLSSLKAAFEALAGKRGFEPGFEGNGASSMDPEVATDESDLVSGRTMKVISDHAIGPMRILPLYAMLPASSQLRVFEEVKEGERLVVVATNVAETSLTIPGIKYVVDTGRQKVKKYDTNNGMEAYEIQWISKASAAQRAGRAGRTGPGHCYRLYSPAVFSNIFPEFSDAEILKVPVDGVILLMKSMHIGKVANFPFPTPPEVTAIVEAEHCLKVLGALDNKGQLTMLGKAMARYPMSPRHSRMLLTVIQIMQNVNNYPRANLVLGYAVAAAAALSLSNPFTVLSEGSQKENDETRQGDKSDTTDDKKILDKLRKKKLKETAKNFRAKFSNPSSDVLTTAFALQCFELSTNPVEFCSDNALHLKTLEEMSKLRKQLLQLIFSSNVSDSLSEFAWTHGEINDVERAWRAPAEKNPLLLNEEEIVGQAICAGWADRVAKRTKGTLGLSEGDRKVNAVRYQACSVKETVFLHRWSSLSKFAPEFLVYSELLLTKRPYIHGATSVKAPWLVKYAQSMCSFSSPHSDPKPYYDPEADQVFCWVTPTFGPHLWQLPLHCLPIMDDMNRVAVFAFALLVGQVLPCIKPVRKFMAGNPATILRPEASGVKRVGNLLNKLKGRKGVIDNCAMLRQLWKGNPRELFSELQDWFQEGFHDHFEELWREMHREIRLNPTDRFSRQLKKTKRRV